MNNILKIGTKELLLITILLVCLLLKGVYDVRRFEGKIYNQIPQDTTYDLAWPGILPDNKLYKAKVLRNKIIEKIIISPIKKIEFDLLMADKTIYASQILVEKGEIDLAKETALKGENYFSMLVQDYNKALLEGKKIPPSLDNRITLAYITHQKIFQELEDKVSEKDKETFRIVNKFSKINYQFIVGLRSSRVE